MPIISRLRVVEEMFLDRGWRWDWVWRRDGEFRPVPIMHRASTILYRLASVARRSIGHIHPRHGLLRSRAKALRLHSPHLPGHYVAPVADTLSFFVLPYLPRYRVLPSLFLPHLCASLLPRSSPFLPSIPSSFLPYLPFYSSSRSTPGIHGKGT